MATTMATRKTKIRETVGKTWLKFQNKSLKEPLIPLIKLVQTFMLTGISKGSVLTSAISSPSFLLSHFSFIAVYFQTRI